MLSFFRNNQLIRSLFLLFYAAILKIPLFFYPYPDKLTGGYLGEVIAQRIESKSIAIGLSILITFLAGVYLNKIVIENRLTRESTLFPGLFFILLVSIIPEMGILSPPLLGLLPFLIALEYLLHLYKNTEYSGKLFNIGFWISTASLFYFAYFYFVIFVFISISILKFVRVADFFRILIGILTPYLLMFYYFFWIGESGTIIHEIMGSYLGFIHFPLIFNLAAAIKFGLAILIMVVGVLNFGQYIKKKNVQAINKIDVIYWGSAMAGLTLFVAHPLTIYHLVLLMPFLAIIMAMMFINLSNQIVGEVLHLALLGVGFLIHYITFV